MLPPPLAADAPDFAAVRAELGVPAAFPAEVLAAAEAAAGAPRLPALDATDLPLVTVDPPGSTDLDQALHLAAREGGGFRLSYAIADVAAFVEPGSPIDAEAHRRGETYYSPDVRTPLHPPVLAEGAASLLPDGPRPALLWRIDTDADGEPVSVDVRRALVRSRAQLSYEGLQQALDAGTAPDSVALLPAFGRAALRSAAARGSVELALPEQEVVPRDGGGWTLAFRAPLPVEEWNAQVSLLTGRCAARLMLDAGVGLLRTLPPPAAETVAALRRAAPPLGVDWPEGARPGDVLRTLDRSRPAHAAFLDLAAALLRGAGYTPFDGAPPEQPEHAGVAAAYAHVTAPLRRLADRYTGEVCVAVCAGGAVPEWARAALPDLPAAMTASGRTAHALERAAVDATEAWLLRDRVGEQFPAVVVEADGNRGTVVVDEPAVRARCDGGDLPLGERVVARLAEADVVRRTVRFVAES